MYGIPSLRFLPEQTVSISDMPIGLSFHTFVGRYAGILLYFVPPY